MTIYRGLSGVSRQVKQQYRGLSGINRTIKEQYRGYGGVNRKVFTSNLIIEDLFDGSTLDSSKWTYSYNGAYNACTVSGGRLTLGYGANYSAGSDSMLTSVVRTAAFADYKIIEAEVDIQSITDGSYQEVFFGLPFTNTSSWKNSAGVFVSTYPDNNGLYLMDPKGSTVYTYTRVAAYPTFPYNLKIRYNSVTHVLTCFGNGVELGSLTVTAYAPFSDAAVFHIDARGRAKIIVNGIKLTLSN